MSASSSTQPPADIIDTTQDQDGEQNESDAESSDAGPGDEENQLNGDSQFPSASSSSKKKKKKEGKIGEKKVEKSEVLRE